MRKHGYIAVIEQIRDDESLGFVGVCCCGKRTRLAKQKVTAQRNLVDHIKTARVRRPKRRKRKKAVKT